MYSESDQIVGLGHLCYCNVRCHSYHQHRVVFHCVAAWHCSGITIILNYHYYYVFQKVFYFLHL